MQLRKKSLENLQQIIYKLNTKYTLLLDNSAYGDKGLHI